MKIQNEANRTLPPTTPPSTQPVATAAATRTQNEPNRALRNSQSTLPQQRTPTSKILQNEATAKPTPSILIPATNPAHRNRPPITCRPPQIAATQKLQNEPKPPSPPPPPPAITSPCLSPITRKKQNEPINRNLFNLNKQTRTHHSLRISRLINTAYLPCRYYPSRYLCLPAGLVCRPPPPRLELGE